MVLLGFGVHWLGAAETHVARLSISDLQDEKIKKNKSSVINLNQEVERSILSYFSGLETDQKVVN